MAEKKEQEVKPEERIHICWQEIQVILDKYNCEIDVSYQVDSALGKKVLFAEPFIKAK